MEMHIAAGHRFAVSSRAGDQPTVVFETGLGAEAQEWADVADALAPHATLFYDRLNRGNSDTVAGPRTCVDMANDLRAVLETAGAPAPYVVVGHSFGAHVTLAFAAATPHVVGVVLVDPTHPLQFDTFGPLLPEGAMRDFWTEGWKRTDSTPEHIDMPASFAATDGIRLGSTPLVVVAGGATMGPGAPQAQQLWLELATQWLEISDAATLQVAEGSGHFIQRDQPEAVVAAIRTILDGGG